MNEEQREVEAYAVWKALVELQGRCWQVGVGHDEATPGKLHELGAALLGQARRLLEAGEKGQTPDETSV